MVFIKQQLLCSKWLQNSLNCDTSYGVKVDISDISFPRQHDQDAFVRILSQEPIVIAQNMLLQMESILREMRVKMCIFLFFAGILIIININGPWTFGFKSHFLSYFTRGKSVLSDEDCKRTKGFWEVIAWGRAVKEVSFEDISKNATRVSSRRLDAWQSFVWSLH